MPQPLGSHNPRIAQVRDLLTKKGRETQRAFLLEGPTLLEEARAARIGIDAVYATSTAFERFPIAREIERDGVPVYTIDDRTARKLSGVETPSGLLASAPARYVDATHLFEDAGVILLLAGISDPGNAGTLLRSADAFGVDRVIFASGSVEPYHPKVVRAAMGSLFRARVAVSSPSEVSLAAQAAEWSIAGLSAEGDDLRGAVFPSRLILAVGQERHGLGEWQALCERTLAIHMPGHAESLNAAVAGSIALYQACASRS